MENKSYTIIQSPEYNMIKLVGRCDPISAKMFLAELKSLLADGHKHLIINCVSVEGLSIEWLRSFFTLQTALKTDEKSLVLILVNDEIKLQFREKGLNSSFKMAANLRDALADLCVLTKKMLDTEFINPFLNATLHVLKVKA